MQKVGNTKGYEEIVARIERLKGKAVYQPICSECKDKKMIPGDPAHPEQGLKRCEACKPKTPASNPPASQSALSRLASQQAAQGGTQ
jgi:hypothetical protein